MPGWFPHREFLHRTFISLVREVRVRDERCRAPFKMSSLTRGKQMDVYFSFESDSFKNVIFMRMKPYGWETFLSGANRTTPFRKEPRYGQATLRLTR